MSSTKVNSWQSPIFFISPSGRDLTGNNLFSEENYYLRPFKMAVKKSFHAPRLVIYDCVAVKGKTSRPYIKLVIYYWLTLCNIFSLCMQIILYWPALDSSLSRSYKFITNLLSPVRIYRIQAFQSLVFKDLLRYWYS